MIMNKEELRKLEAYLRNTLGTSSLSVKPRPRKDDSAEVYIGEEFIGVLYLDEDDEEVDEGDRSYSFQMAILEYDLEGL